jgi:hypothetical protein
VGGRGFPSSIINIALELGWDFTLLCMLFVCGCVWWWGVRLIYAHLFTHFTLIYI